MCNCHKFVGSPEFSFGIDLIRIFTDLPHPILEGHVVRVGLLPRVVDVAGNWGRECYLPGRVRVNKH